MKRLLLLLGIGWAVQLTASPALTPNEQKYLPVLQGEIAAYWPDHFAQSMFAAQVQQETCPSLQSKKCWSPTAELKTSREYGFGLGQITKTARFDNFQEVKKLDKSLVAWTWDNRYNAQYQLRALVLQDKAGWSKFGKAASDTDRMAFALAAYNGGLGGVLSDRAVCQATPGCDRERWFNHVERTSKKAKVAANGYGQSFFQINRLYITNVTGPRRARYLAFFGETWE